MKIETRSLGEQVYNYLCTQIIEGGINYGEGLNIKLIAKDLGVSSMPVREAIKRLEIEGVVTIKPRSTCLVRMPTKESILNALEMRELIEIHCVETACRRAAAAELEPLRAIIRGMKKTVEGGSNPASIGQYIKYDRQFHTELCKLARNDFVDKFYREVSLHLNMKFIYDIAVPPDIAGTFQHHSRILECLAENSKEAIPIIKQHLHDSRQNVLRGSLFGGLDDSAKQAPRA